MIHNLLFPFISLLSFIKMHNVKCNFKNIHLNLDCLGCQSYEDSQSHLLNCPIINTHMTEKPQYEDLFSDDPRRQQSNFRYNEHLRAKKLNFCLQAYYTVLDSTRGLDSKVPYSTSNSAFTWLFIVLLASSMTPQRMFSKAE